MKKALAIIAIIALTKLNAQKRYTLPEGFKVFNNIDGKEVKVASDFDSDGVADFAIMTESANEKGDNYLCVFIGSTYLNTGTIYYVPIGEAADYTLEYKNKVLTFGSCFGNGRYCETYKYKYYSNLRNMRLIGYESEYFGNAVNDGEYKKSINFLTKRMEYITNTKTVKAINIGVITLENFDEETRDYLNSLE